VLVADGATEEYQVLPRFTAMLMKKMKPPFFLVAKYAPFIWPERWQIRGATN
jgi:hypothetical protein